MKNLKKMVLTCAAIGAIVIGAAGCDSGKAFEVNTNKIEGKILYESPGREIVWVEKKGKEGVIWTRYQKGKKTLYEDSIKKPAEEWDYKYESKMRREHLFEYIIRGKKGNSLFD